MKFKKIFLTVCLMLVSAVALADWHKPAAPERQDLNMGGVTTQYLYNVEAGMFLVGGNENQTRASLSDTLGSKVKVSYEDEGYSISCYVHKFCEFRKMSAPDKHSVWIDNNNGANCNIWSFYERDNREYTIVNGGVQYTLATSSRRIAENDTRLYFDGAYIITDDIAYYDASVYQMWYSVSEEEYDRYVEAMKVYYTAQELGKAIEVAENNWFGLDVSAEKAVYNNEDSTIEQLMGAIASLKANQKVYLEQETTKDMPCDMTSYIVNPSFEEGGLNGWTAKTSDDTGVKNNENGTYHTEDADGAFIFNTWSVGYPVSQSIENLPNGVYKLSGMAASSSTNVYLFANGGMKDANENTVNAHKAINVGGDASMFTGGEMWFAVEDGTVTIGAIGAAADGKSYSEEGEFWYKADNFHLTYYGNRADAYMEVLMYVASEFGQWLEENSEKLTEAKRTKLAKAIFACDELDGKNVDELIVLLKNLYAAYADAQEPLHYRVDESKRITADATDLDGVTAVVTDMAGTKTWAAFSGGDGQDVNANCTSVYDWSSKSEYSYIKFYHVAGQRDDVYYIKFVNADGEWYNPRGTWHGNKGCLNVTGNGAGLFVGGNTNFINGQDVGNGALWIVAKTAEGYSLYNVGKERYAVPGIGVTSTETSVKLYTEFSEFDSYTVTLNNAGFATFSSSINTKITTEGVKAYKASVEDETITLTEIEGNIPAGTGVLLYGETAGTQVNLSLATSGDAADVTGNALKATTKADGTLASFETNTWALGEGDQFLNYTGTAYIHNRAYLVHTKPAGVRAMRIVFAEDETTAIDNAVIKTSASEGKFLENGKIVIVKNGVKYNVVGLRIK